MRKKILLGLFIACTVLCGCNNTDMYVTTGNGITNAFVIGDMKCSKKEVGVYTAAVSNYYGSIGDVDSAGFELIDDILKKSSLSILTRVYTLNQYAKDKGIKLTKEEENSVKKASKEFFGKLTDDDKKIIDAQESDIREMYTNYAIAMKVYADLMEGVDVNVTEDEARVMEAYVIYLPDDTNVYDVESKFAAGGDFVTIAQGYSTESKELLTFGRGEHPQEFDEVAFSLEDGEQSPRITTDEGIYYVLCVSKYKELESEKNKLKIIERRQKSLLDQIENEQYDNYYSEYNERFFDTLSPSKLRISVGEEFFSIIERSLSF